MRAVASFAALLAALSVVVACGSDAGDGAGTATVPPTTPRRAVVEGYARLLEAPSRVDSRQIVEFEAPGAPDDVRRAVEGVVTTTAVTESEQVGRSRTRITVEGSDESVVMTIYDGQVFVELPSGDVRRLGGAAGATFGRLAEIATAGYAESLVGVTEVRPGVVGGEAVRRYRATIAAVYLEGLTGDAIADAGGDPDLAKGMVVDASVEVDLRDDGSVARQRSVVVLDFTRIVDANAQVLQTTTIVQRFSPAPAIRILRPAAEGEPLDLLELGRLLQSG